METRYYLLIIAVLLCPLAAFAQEATPPDKSQNVLRVWRDTQGRTITATFRGVEDGNAFLQTKDGYVYRIPLERLVPGDQDIARQLKPEGLGIPADPNVAQAAARIDEIVAYGLKAMGVTPNALASDEQFCRRVYLDLVGRIPTREETMAFLSDTSSSKRAKVIDKLINSEGFNARMFSYFADMLRMTDDAQKAKFFTYEEWFKSQIWQNRPYDKIVFDLMTASGKLVYNGASGYLLRDKGMRLDNLSVTLSTFLGANVACAQCHDHPFADWTQKQFYEMAAFFGTTETYDNKNSKKMLAGLKKELTDDELKRVKKLVQVNALEVHENGYNDVKLPDDYKYKDGKPGGSVSLKLIKWEPATDVQKLPLHDPVAMQRLQASRDQLYKTVEASLNKKGGGENPRVVFAKWMTSPSNPRFAMTISNRLWKLVFGIAVKEPVTDLDNAADANNPMLLGHIANEMVRLKFDLRAFMRLLCNTQTYQREASTKQVVAGEPYYFPGPTLRRMTAEQAWDSCVTLAIGEKVDNYKLRRAGEYTALMGLKGKVTASEIRAKLDGMKQAIAKFGGKNKPGKNANKKMMRDSDSDDVDHTRPDVLQGQVLARASELPQPEKDQHFLRMFGQSDRQISDTGSDEGSIPQVLMLMNGQTQSVLRNPKSLVLATANKQAGAEMQIESLYLSFFTRHPKAEEMKDAKDALASGMTLADLTWVLFNSREFMFVQ